MLDDRQEVYIKIIGDRMYIRMVNRKMISHICELIGVPLEEDENEKRIYVDTIYMDKLIIGLLSSKKVVKII